MTPQEKAEQARRKAIQNHPQRPTRPTWEEVRQGGPYDEATKALLPLGSDKENKKAQEVGQFSKLSDFLTKCSPFIPPPKHKKTSS